jgi:hypothetical protein
MAGGRKNLVKDWNAEFQDILHIRDDLVKWEKLRDLAGDFAYAAETYGRIIISEERKFTFFLMHI